MKTLKHTLGTALIDPIGARVVQWAPSGMKPVLWAPPKRLAGPQEWAHGGIPLCFPWFAKPPQPGLPFHGLVHSVGWQEIDRVSDHQDLRSSWAPKPAPDALDGWRLQLDIVVGSTLALRLEATNTADVARTASPCFHCYLATADRDACRIAGMEGSPGIDKQRQGEAITLPSKPWAPPETMDRIVHHAGPVSLRDPTMERSLTLTPAGTSETVCWAPGQGACDAVPELGSGAARSNCCCIEPAAGLREPLLVPANSRIELGLTITVD